MNRLLLTALAILAFAYPAQAQDKKVLRIGIIGCDTSHVTVFTSIFNDPKAAEDPDLAGFKVVAAFPGGSDDLPVSRDRVKNFTATLRDKYGLEIVDSIEALLPKVDVVLLESVDGRVHWAQAEKVLKAGKPVFIDKPFAATLADALRIAALAKQTKTPIFSCSSLRYGKAIVDLKSDAKAGPIIGCSTYGPSSIIEHHPDLAFYGIHGLEMVYALMGSGCKTVTRTHTKDCDVVTGVWADGRVASYRGTRAGKADFGGTVFCKNAIITSLPSDGYKPMVRQIGKFFRTGISPVSSEELVEVIAVIEAADLSKNQGGAPVAIADVMKAAQAKSTP